MTVRDCILPFSSGTATAIFRLAVLAQLDSHRIGRRIEFALHMAAEVKVASVRDPFKLAIFSWGQERKRIFDICGTDAVVGQLGRFMFAHDQ